MFHVKHLFLCRKILDELIPSKPHMRTSLEIHAGARLHARSCIDCAMRRRTSAAVASPAFTTKPVCFFSTLGHRAHAVVPQQPRPSPHQLPGRRTRQGA